MSEIINIYGQSNSAILRKLGAFIKHQRLGQNKTQEQLAAESGINRTTLVECEKGRNINLLTFIQLLRMLHQLHLLNQFEVVQHLSPLLLAEMEQKKRKRASRVKSKTKNTKSQGW